jgi:hypothetical protein
VVETCIKNEILSGRIAHCPKISNSLALQEWLSEMPDFSRQRESMQGGMRNRQRLTELTTPDGALVQLCEKDVCVTNETLSRPHSPKSEVSWLGFRSQIQERLRHKVYGNNSPPE